MQRRVDFKIACLAHQSLTSTAPTYLSTDIQLVSEHGRRHLHSSSYRTLAVPRTRTTLGDISFAVAGPRVWISLSAMIRQITSYGEFRQHLKTHLFRAEKSQRIVTILISALYKYSYLLTYLLNAVGLTSIQYRRQRQISVVHARSDISSEARSPLVSSSSSSIG